MSEPVAQKGDLGLLGLDDVLGQGAQLGILAVFEDDARHVDGPLVVADHTAREVDVGVVAELLLGHDLIEPLAGMVRHSRRRGETRRQDSDQRAPHRPASQGPTAAMARTGTSKEDELPAPGEIDFGHGAPV